MVRVLPLDVNHMAKNIKKWFNSMLDSWNIQKSKITVVVPDNAAYMKKAVIDCFGEEKYLPYFAHTLNLVSASLLDEYKDINDIINKLKSIVTYFKNSFVASEFLCEVTQLTLIQSNYTRWN